eukprot:g39362.t1
MQAALAASRRGKHHVLTDFVARYEDNHLNFSATLDLGDSGASAVAKGLQDHPSVTSVDLRGNNLSMESGSALAAVAKQNSRIKEMCGIPLDSLRENKITGLDLTYQRLGLAEAVILAEFLKENKSVLGLRMGANRIGPAGAETIANIFKVHRSLKELRLWNNKIGPEGAKAIAAALEENKEWKLETLDISWNQIGAEGAQHIAKALEVNNSLTELTLDGIEIGDAGAIAIANALQVNKTLIKITLTSNRIGHDGAIAIGVALQVNNMLTSLELSNNNIGDAGEQYMKPLLYRAALCWDCKQIRQLPVISTDHALLHFMWVAAQGSKVSMCHGPNPSRLSDKDLIRHAQEHELKAQGRQYNHKISEKMRKNLFKKRVVTVETQLALPQPSVRKVSKCTKNILVAFCEKAVLPTTCD